MFLNSNFIVQVNVDELLMEKLDINTSDNDPYNHRGVVSKILDDKIIISLKGNVNCEGCKAKSACGVSESNDKEIEVLKSAQSFNLNEEVDVVLSRELGLKAVFWAYLFPFILMVFTLLVSSGFVKEWISGLISLFILIPYYIILYLFQENFRKVFKVSLFKIN